MDIAPETKDWTWVLSRPCAECGTDVSNLTMSQSMAQLRRLQPLWRAEMQRADLTRRPNSRTWSRLEYAAHVRDALQVFQQRLALMVAEDAPTFADWDQDAAARTGKYNQLDPQQTATQLDAELDAVLNYLAQLSPEVYQRLGKRSDGAAFTVVSLTQYFVHDVAHHLVDVQNQA